MGTLQYNCSTFEMNESNSNNLFTNTQQFTILKNIDKDEDMKIIEMQDVLDYLENKTLNASNDSEVLLQMDDKFGQNKEDSYEGSKYFAVKTIQVEWESHQHAFMHVFINVSNVKKLEKAKATNK